MSITISVSAARLLTIPCRDAALCAALFTHSKPVSPTVNNFSSQSHSHLKLCVLYCGCLPARHTWKITLRNPQGCCTHELHVPTFPQAFRRQAEHEVCNGKKWWIIWLCFLRNSHFLPLEVNLNEVLDEHIGEIKASIFNITEQGAVYLKNK